MGGVFFVKSGKWGCFCKKVENGWVFFCKKWTFPQRRVHYVQYQYFLFFILLTHPFPPTDLCQTYRQRQTLLFNWLRLIAQDGLSTRIFVVSMHALTSGFQASRHCSSFARRWILVFFNTVTTFTFYLPLLHWVECLPSFLPSYAWKKVASPEHWRSIVEIIDVKTFFTFFYFGHVFTFLTFCFYFPNVFLFLKTLAKFRAARRLTRSNFKVTATK